MTISESQLETWSHQGSKVQSAKTHQEIKSVLEDKDAPYANKSFEIFLQGSYGNDTNIYSESDVDIVICLTEAINSDTSKLEPSQKAAYEADRVIADYGFHKFKSEVVAWLRKKLGSNVTAGNKAIFVPGNGSRRDADVLACVEHRRFTYYQSQTNSRYHKGISFWTSDKHLITNFPRQHMDNCTAKHQGTEGRFKSNVRVLKNFRRAMVDEKVLAEGVAPSYFLEGMLWNVPNEKFVGTYQRTFEGYFDWLIRCDPTKLACANDLHWLIRDGAVECWNLKDFQKFMKAARSYWDASDR